MKTATEQAATVTPNGDGHAAVPFEPLQDYCLLEPIAKNKTAGGVVLPDNMSEDDMSKSLVIKAGPGRYNPMTGTLLENPIKVGDIVYHMALTQPIKVKLNGKNYLCLAGNDIMAKCS